MACYCFYKGRWDMPFRVTYFLSYPLLGYGFLGLVSPDIAESVEFYRNKGYDIPYDPVYNPDPAKAPKPQSSE